MRTPKTEHHLQFATRVRATLILTGALAAVLAAPGRKSSKCYPDCIAGYEPVPNACTCRPVADAAADGKSSDETDGSPLLDAAVRQPCCHHAGPAGAD